MSGDIDESAQAIERKYGIAVEYETGDAAIPELWRNPPANGTAEPMTKANLCRYLPVLAHELDKYPADVIRQNLATVYLLNSLGFFGVQYGGTSLDHSIYLTGGNTVEGYDDSYFATLFHHEMSSIFFRNYDFPTEEWNSVNPGRHVYAKSDRQILQAITDGEDDGGDESLYSEGFLSKYGYSTLENDFNLYAEMAFTHPRQLRQLAEKYPRIRKKSELLRKFYTGISRDFHLDY
ncbi:MAG TPA: hypothetical protein ENJ80_03165 [Gammaproteobacteria bacterium]|nr:hypothetical protein [Gammaproteobacteria bacterium]